MARKQASVRTLRRSIYMIAEGEKTEREYFNFLRTLIDEDVSIDIAPRSSKTAPSGLVRHAKQRSANREYSEIWIVYDRDSWPQKELDVVSTWVSKNSGNLSAISIPNFEYWLLLHFEAGSGVQTRDECKVRLKKYWPDYDKGIPKSKFTKKQVMQAVNRAGARPGPQRGSLIATTELHKLIQTLHIS